jgi:catechol 2,3-dioxygenase-like lactoylglutathione lyase family enzyme
MRKSRIPLLWNMNMTGLFSSQSTNSARALMILLVLLLPTAFAVSQTEPLRPKILGIQGVVLRTSNLSSANHFYLPLVDPEKKCDICWRFLAPGFELESGQWIHLDASEAKQSTSLLSMVSFETDDLSKLKQYLSFHRVPFVQRKHSEIISVPDPEGHEILFSQKQADTEVKSPTTSARRIIHVGFVVHDRAAEDHFYKDVLGFHVYWHGGMKEGEDNWVDMQVPDGTDWIEYMLNVPANADHHTLGVMNHIALGVPDIKAAREQLIKNGWAGTEQPKIGRDGKWQLNLYDPDDTRVEFMEFTPTQKPCCSEYTGPHPGQKP